MIEALKEVMRNSLNDQGKDKHNWKKSINPFKKSKNAKKKQSNE